MEKGEPGEEDFRKGLQRATEEGRGALTHLLFGVRSLGLFERLARTSLASYLSGLLIGTEMKDAVGWSGARSVIAIGSPKLLENYRIAAEHFGLGFEAHDNSTLLPPALYMIARNAGLMP